MKDRLLTGESGGWDLEGTCGVMGLELGLGLAGLALGLIRAIFLAWPCNAQFSDSIYFSGKRQRTFLVYTYMQVGNNLSQVCVSVRLFTLYLLNSYSQIAFLALTVAQCISRIVICDPRGNEREPKVSIYRFGSG